MRGTRGNTIVDIFLQFVQFNVKLRFSTLGDLKEVHVNTSCLPQ